MRYATLYLNQVLEKVKPLLRGNGGPIIMVQVTFTYETKKYHYDYVTYATSQRFLKIFIAFSKIVSFYKVISSTLISCLILIN